MKTMKYFAMAMLALVGLSLQSCSDDDNYDVKGNPNNLTYIALNSTNTVTCAIVQTPIGTFGEVNGEFPVKIQRAVTTNTTVSATIDNSMIDDYNDANDTEYEAIPNDIPVTITNATILQDTIASYDSITVSIDDAYLPQLTNTNGYLIPIRLSSISGDSKAQASEERGYGYVVINVSQTLLRDGGTEDQIPGTMLATSETTDWECSLGSWSTLIDGSTWSYLAYSNGSAWTVDMKKVYKVGGIAYFNTYGDWGYNASSIKLELSEDGNTWTDCGTATNMATNSDGYQIVCLYGAVSARYIRLTVNARYSWAAACAELRVYTE